MVDLSKLIDYFKISLNNIAKRGLRSWLTMIGIFIGIAAVVALISLGEGLQVAVNEEFEDLGANLIIISPAGAFFGVGGVDALTEDDIDLVRKVRGVDKAVGNLYTMAQFEWKDQVFFYSLFGMEPTRDAFELFEQSDYSLLQGREFRSGEKYKAIAGYDYFHSDAFDKKLRLGSKLLINNQEFEIIGVWSQVGNPTDDRSIAIPMDTARELLDIPDRIDSIFLAVKGGEDPSVVASRIEESMRKDRGLKEGEEDFAIQTLQDVLNSFLVILDIITVALTGIAAISLIVGFIGIMNTMYTSVLERTKEIGIMKAIGARNGDVLLLFLIESGLLGLAGGIIGVIFGASLSSLVAYAAQNFGGFDLLKAVFPWYLIVGSLLFGFLVGVLSGVLPARQAALKNPVDSLRYE